MCSNVTFLCFLTYYLKSACCFKFICLLIRFRWLVRSFFTIRRLFWVGSCHHFISFLNCKCFNVIIIKFSISLSTFLRVFFRLLLKINSNRNKFCYRCRISFVDRFICLFDLQKCVSSSPAGIAESFHFLVNVVVVWFNCLEFLKQQNSPTKKNYTNTNRNLVCRKKRSLNKWINKIYEHIEADIATENCVWYGVLNVLLLRFHCDNWILNTTTHTHKQFRVRVIQCIFKQIIDCIFFLQNFISVSFISMQQQRIYKHAYARSGNK